MRNTIATILVGALVVMGCGQKKDQDKKEASPEISAEDKAKLDDEFAAIPQAAIIRVPVNEAGETTGAPEMKVVSDATGLETADGAAVAFDSGAAPARMVTSADELDGDTSTQSWSAYAGYGNTGSYGGDYDNGNGYGGGNNGGVYGDGNNGGGYGDGNNGGGYGGGNNGGGYGGGNNGGGYGNNGNYGGWGHDYWYNNYKPVLYYGQNTWNYGYTRPNYYHTSGYRYYCYRPNRWW